ncbi:MAG TPA: enoyl-CoA hydratase-related protein [Solirubrobacteraceae bacterium]|jgi:2-(1,2-epoxy-1,2-dihydrophenyl)acetyl-CoA isomerase|nr:enoyl-CoA hydratase-related protein [Solirubrobacteraceae bacterium]
MPITLDVQDGIARLTLVSGATRNPINPDFTAALQAHGAALAAREDVRVVVLRAEGPAFCVGGDLDWMAALDPEEVEPELYDLAAGLHVGIEALVTLDAPLLTAVHGAAAGAGLSLTCASDVVIAGESAMFTVAYTAAGLSPDGGLTWYLPRIVGLRKATELILTNARLSARDAAEIGIVTRVVPDADLDEATEAMARALSAGATAAYGSARRLLRESGTRLLHEHLADEATTVARHAAGVDGREGISAFVSKRRPAFQGRS